MFRLQTARDATPAHPGAESGRLQVGATATPTPCQPRWALTDCPGAAMVTAEGASRGFTLEVRLESETEAGEEAGVSIMVTSGHSDWDHWSWASP